jgi:hypothetical protein
MNWGRVSVHSRRDQWDHALSPSRFTGEVFSILQTTAFLHIGQALCFLRVDGAHSGILIYGTGETLPSGYAMDAVIR